MYLYVLLGACSDPDTCNILPEPLLICTMCHYQNPCQINVLDSDLYPSICRDLSLFIFLSNVSFQDEKVNKAYICIFSYYQNYSSECATIM